MVSINMTIKVNKAAANDFTKGERSKSLKNAANLLEGMASGILHGDVDASVHATDPVAASVTATLVSCATDTITILGVTLTGSGSPSGAAQFETDGNDTADAAALAACINAHATLSKYVYATSALGVVTITALVKGEIGNYLMPCTETGTTITLSNSGAFTGGTGGVASIPTYYKS